MSIVQVLHSYLCWTLSKTIAILYRKPTKWGIYMYFTCLNTNDMPSWIPNFINILDIIPQQQVIEGKHLTKLSCCNVAFEIVGHNYRKR